MGLTYLAMAVFCALCYPAAWRRRLTAAAGIAAGMVLLNALRILLLYHLWVDGDHHVHEVVHRAGGFFFAAFGLVLFVAAFTPRPAPRKEPAVGLAAPEVAVGQAR